ncbi:radical SAM protein [Candidatus Woesearchaeota archaeon]|nr:radical SAM protein [Candidatus Woesearchaeota archaeon]
MKVIRFPKCNYNCIFCFEDKEALAEPIISIKDNEKLLITGGEPFCSSKLKSVLEECKRKKAKLKIQTNASILYSEGNVKYLEKFKDMIEEIIIGFHSHEPRIYAEITQTNFYDKVIQALHNLSKSKLNITVNHTLIKQNYLYALDFLKFIKEKFPRIKKIYMTFVYPSGNALQNVEDVMPKISDTKDIVKNCIMYSKDNGLQLEFISCGIPGYPLCFLRSYFSIEELNKICQHVIQKGNNALDFNNVKFKICEGCTFNDTCAGVPQQYVDIYGETEFKNN